MNEYEQNLYNKLINKEEIDEGDISELVFGNEIIEKIEVVGFGQNMYGQL